MLVALLQLIRSFNLLALKIPIGQKFDPETNTTPLVLISTSREIKKLGAYVELIANLLGTNPRPRVGKRLGKVSQL